MKAGKKLKFIPVNDIKNISRRIKGEDVEVTSTNGSKETKTTTTTTVNQSEVKQAIKPQYKEVM